MPPSPDPARLRALVRAVDADLAPTAGGAILHATDPLAPGDTLARFPLDGTHPLDLLVGLVAPRHWAALGVSCTGTARAAGRPPERVRVTILLDRSGGAAGVMRRGAAVGDLPGRPEGVVADACRRALALPTTPPPATTAGLWALLWLDRLVAAAGGATPCERPQTWSSVALLHPAAGPRGDPATAVRDPDGLVAAAAGLAAAWPWQRLRTRPAGAPLPVGPSAGLAVWMDDGMWARWLLADLPGAGDLLSAVRGLLAPGLAGGVARVVAAALD
ncbi:MAG TPA: hypothetical protein VFZ77_09730 [Acidimicrobiales bacterium]